VSEFICRQAHDSINNSLSRAELQLSVSYNSGTVFRSFSSLAEANTKYELFLQSIRDTFAGVADPFSAAGSAALRPARDDPQAGEDAPLPAPASESVTQPPVARGPPGTIPQVAGPSTQSTVTVQDEEALGPITKSILRRVRAGASGKTNGWYVVFHGVSPGVSFGS
jgi:hypothetical protein